ncbi:MULTISPECIES: AraC family transcriptional regulator [unclassified Pseudomonas]|uniref:AraC family transcriptional regulator n=1 Tax=unclassified Pseudomonas TaxID=196821 RepID=UPI00177DA071|nr:MULTISPECIES: AraC family transcriptional regulator [unclassified Pseudomonas]MBD8595909.1 AraC family transcriptional regulator [Pseudomonas sp. CFBP 8758]MBD8733552.1 AraC family transcriptional regulator [Pseudomonas sp. CFBP 13710]
MRAFNGVPQLDIDIFRNDESGAHAWMTSICGPHDLNVARPGHVDFRHVGRVLNTATIGYIEYGTDAQIDVYELSNFDNFCISLPIVGSQELILQGKSILSDQNTGCIIAPFQAQRLSMDKPCKKIQLTLPSALLHEKLEHLLRRRVASRLEFSPSIDAASGASGNWWGLIKYYLDESPLGLSAFGKMHLAAEIESIIVKSLLFSQPSNYTDELTETSEKTIPPHIKKARCFIELNAKYELSLEDIETAAGVSRYKLLNDFRKCLNTSPMAYLKKYRLMKIREALLSDRCSTNVSTVAMNWGCSHLGRFSTEYRALFGESPSVTSRRFDSKAHE